MEQNTTKTDLPVTVMPSSMSESTVATPVVKGSATPKWLMPVFVVQSLCLVAAIAYIVIRISAPEKIAENLKPTPTPTPFVTQTIEVTPTLPPTVTVEAVKSEKYSDNNVSMTIPAGWKKVLTADGKTLIRLEKNDYYFYATSGLVTGGGFGYPFDGMCEGYTNTKSSVTVNKLGARYDFYFDLSKDQVNQLMSESNDGKTYTNAELCEIDKTKQKGTVVWLGSRVGVDSTGTSYNTYFNLKTDSSINLDVTYTHKNIELNQNAETGYQLPLFDSAEVKAMISEMDTIAKTVVFKKTLINEY